MATVAGLALSMPLWGPSVAVFALTYGAWIQLIGFVASILSLMLLCVDNSSTFNSLLLLKLFIQEIILFPLAMGRSFKFSFDLLANTIMRITNWGAGQIVSKTATEICR